MSKLNARRLLIPTLIMLPWFL